MTKKQKRTLYRILLAAVLLACAYFLPTDGTVKLCAYLLSYAIAGYDILIRAVVNIAHGQVFDENFLMTIATAGAYFTGSYAEGAAVMLFYQIGELFQSCAVARSRRSIAQMMDICPTYANVEEDGVITEADPAAVPVGGVIVVKPGEKIPLDGVIVEGASSIDSAAITGESMPRAAAVGDPVASGCINQSGLLRVWVTKPYAQSTAAQIIELVENASARKAKAEQFITKFARWYTPLVVISAALLALIPSVITGEWRMWVHRALIFLVISCPCALVISVPLTFFGGIGGASRRGILVKGGNYLEVLARAETVVFDKTGTLSEGVFRVMEIHPVGISENDLLSLAAHAEACSNHPISQSVRNAYGAPVDASRVSDAVEQAGYGIRAVVDGKEILVGNERMMEQAGIADLLPHAAGTAVHVAGGGQYYGCIVIADAVKPDAKEAITLLKALGVQRTVILTGDNGTAAGSAAEVVGVDAFHAELLPSDKMTMVESLLSDTQHGTLLFVGDGINDAPALMRADAGIAMGGIGTDAAIEAADVVLMNDRPTAIVDAIRLSRRTIRIVRQNIVFALAVKALVLLLGALGYAGMWAAVFADVGVCVLAILNAARALKCTD